MKDSEMEIVITDTPEKFYPMVDVILLPLVELLKAISVLEREIYMQNEKLEEEKLKNGIPKWQSHPDFMDLYQEYKQRYRCLVEPKCSEKLLKRGYATSFGKPGRYDYLNTKCKVVFFMKSTKKATIETLFHQGVDRKEQFIVKSIDGTWKLDEVRYGFSNESTWHAYHI